MTFENYSFKIIPYSDFNYELVYDGPDGEIGNGDRLVAKINEAEETVMPKWLFEFLKTNNGLQKSKKIIYN